MLFRNRQVCYLQNGKNNLSVLKEAFRKRILILYNSIIRFSIITIVNYSQQRTANNQYKFTFAYKNISVNLNFVLALCFLYSYTKPTE